MLYVININIVNKANLWTVQGIMFGVYDTGPWVAIKMAGNDFAGWIGGGTKNFDFNVTFRIVVKLKDSN